MTATARATVGLVIVGLGTLIAPLDTAVNIGFPAIIAAFDLPLQMIQWVVICYVLTYASLTLVFGKLGDLFGYRRIFLTGMLVSAIALALCASAPTYGWLLFFRFLQGIGTALVLSCGLALATRLFPEAIRGRIVGIYTMMFALGTALGPSIGGILVQTFGWSAVFWFRVPIALAVVLVLGLVPEAPREARRQPFDALGSVLLALSLTAMLLALNLASPAQREIGWAAALGALAVVGFAAFVVQEARFSDPLIRVQMFRDIDFAVVNVTNSIVNLVNFSILLLVPFYLVRLTGLSIAVGGLVLAIGSLGTILAALAGGWLVARVRPRRIAFFGAVLVGLGLWLVSRWQSGEAPLDMIVALFLAGIGIGLFQVTYTEIVAGTLSRRDRGVAGSLTMVTRTIGNVTGATALTLIFQRYELAALGGGASASDSFLTAFQQTFATAGGFLLLFLAISLLRPGIWFGGGRATPVRD